MNVRIRGKIRREEWPKIYERFRKGETLTEIARSYHCTAPAIRYIVARASVRPVKGTIEALGTSSRPSSAERGRSSGNVRPLEVPTNEIWSRINNDIATFLTAMDTLSLNESDKAYEALLMATDRLLWASARTRLELEQVIRRRKESSSSRRALG